MAANLRRGFFRIWVVISSLWIALVAGVGGYLIATAGPSHAPYYTYNPHTHSFDAYWLRTLESKEKKYEVEAADGRIFTFTLTLPDSFAEDHLKYVLEHLSRSDAYKTAGQTYRIGKAWFEVQVNQSMAIFPLGVSKTQAEAEIPKWLRKVDLEHRAHNRERIGIAVLIALIPSAVLFGLGALIAWVSIGFREGGSRRL
jgi:hypothetical protein